MIANSDKENLICELLPRLSVDGRGVVTYRSRNGRTYAKTSVDDGHGRLRFHFHLGKGQVSIYANRLVWMIHNGRAIPDGHDVDHIDGNKTNDCPDNLQLMKSNDGDKQGFKKTQSIILDYLGRWFEFVGTHGREPEAPAELTWVEWGF